MVTNVTSLTGNGLRDWLIQRVSALILAVYSVFLAAFYAAHQPLDYLQWHALFSNRVMQIASILVVINLMVHAWIGFWTVTTDYLKPTALRILVQAVMAIALLAIVIWSITIFWGM